MTPPSPSPNAADPRVVRVALDSTAASGASRSYDVRVGGSLILDLGPSIRALLPVAQRCLVVIDAGVPDRLQGAAVGSLAACGLKAATHLVRPSERDKSLATLEGILNAALEARIERQEPIIALGGGIVGDLTGFAAASYRRGVPFVQIPTTLLSMVDASVGGKTGINLCLGGGEQGGSSALLRKNMAGAFWQPRLVLCDIAALDSLPEDEFRSGLAECAKHALIGAVSGDADLWDWTVAHADAIAHPGSSASATATLTELIARNVAIKARVVEQDEREESTSAAGGRMALNAGHTVAHALEALAASAPDSPPLKHGQAVALGLLAEIALGESTGATRPGLSRQVATLLERLGLPVRVSGVDRLDGMSAQPLIQAMHDDKKTAGGKLRFAVPTGDGLCRMVDGPDERHIRAGLACIGVS